MAFGHWKGKTKIYPGDSAFSKYIRHRDELCVFGARCMPRRLFLESGELDVRHLTAAHFIGRAKKAVRYDPENADCACRKCHDWLDHTAEGQQFHKEWKLKQLGQQKYDLLEFRSGFKAEITDEMAATIYKQKIKELPKSLFL